MPSHPKPLPRSKRRLHFGPIKAIAKFSSDLYLRSEYTRVYRRLTNACHVSRNEPLPSLHYKITEQIKKLVAKRRRQRTLFTRANENMLNYMVDRDIELLGREFADVYILKMASIISAPICGIYPLRCTDTPCRTDKDTQQSSVP